MCGPRLDPNRFLDRVSVDSGERNAPDEYLLSMFIPGLYVLPFNRYALSSQKVTTGLPKSSDSPEYSLEGYGMISHESE